MRSQPQDEADRPELAELAALADGSLPAERRGALEERIASSPELADRLAEQQRAIALTQGAAAEVDAPVALRRRIEPLRGARRRREPLRVVAIGGAVAVAAAAIAVLAIRQTSTPGTQFHAALAPTALAPGASGRATLTKTTSGWKIDLRAPGLPRRDGKRFYEAWLRDEDGGLVPIGTFNDGGHVILWAGVSPKEYSTMSVTRERDNGDQGSSGEKVLVGHVDTRG